MKHNKVRARSKANTLEVLDFKQGLVDQRRKHKERLTQGVVAERMGVSQSTVAELERYDSNPTLRTLQRYANAVEALISFRVVDDCGEGTFESITSVQGSMQPKRSTRSYSARSIAVSYRPENNDANPRISTSGRA